ncbi:MAG: cupin domain-containing protein, partial [Sphingomonadales bacterium]|nr:cupin domain-containing protein [Sphingomonadales bacterium]
MASATGSRSMLARARETIERMLGAESYDRFFDEVVGQQPLFIADDSQRQRLTLFPGNTRQTILAAYDSRSSLLTHHAARPTGPAPGRRRAGSAAEFAALIAEHHRNGHTVRIPDAAPLFPALARCVRALEAVLLVRVEAELFWSSEGLSAPVHYDNSDIIAIQLFGAKRWWVSTRPSSLPNPWKLAGERASELGPARHYDMTAGDLLYIPRGTLHT